MKNTALSFSYVCRTTAVPRAFTDDNDRRRHRSSHNICVHNTTIKIIIIILVLIIIIHTPLPPRVHAYNFYVRLLLNFFFRSLHVNSSYIKNWKGVGTYVGITLLLCIGNTDHMFACISNILCAVKGIRCDPRAAVA